MDAETAFRFVGSLGRYQLFLSVLLFLGNFVFSLQMVLMIVVGYNTTLPNENNMTTIVTEFNLYHKPWIVDLMQSLTMGGYMVGCLIFGQLSDSCGRRYPLLIGGFLASITAACSALAPNWQIFAVTRFFTGVFLGGGGVTMFVLLTEYVGKKSWGIVGLIYQIFFSLGICFLGLLGYLLPKWQHLCIVTAASAFFVMFLLILFIMESPRWLYSTGKTKVAEKVLKKIAARNKRDIRDIQSICLSPAEDNATTHTFFDLFRYKKLVFWISITCFVWFTNGLVYYGLTLSASSLVKNLYIGTVLEGAVEIPSTILCIILMEVKWFGRKRTLILLLALCGLSNAILIFIYGIDTAKLILGLGSKLAIAGCFNVIYVYTGEIFPTPLRTVSVAMASIFARIGAIIAPFVSLLKNSFGPYLFYGLLSLVSAFLLVFLPRTLGKPIPQTIEEAVHGPSHQVLVNENSDNENKDNETDRPDDPLA